VRWDRARRHSACGLVALALLTSCCATDPQPDVEGSVAEPAPGATGRLRGRFPSWLAGAGNTWVAVTHGHGTADQLTVEFWTFSSR